MPSEATVTAAIPAAPMDVPATMSTALAEPEVVVPEVTSLDAASLDRVFREARTFSKWSAKQVSDEDLRALYDLLKMGPTSANCSPARFAFLRNPWSKDRLKPALAGLAPPKALSGSALVSPLASPRKSNPMLPKPKA